MGEDYLTIEHLDAGVLKLVQMKNQQPIHKQLEQSKNYDLSSSDDDDNDNNYHHGDNDNANDLFDDILKHKRWLESVSATSGKDEEEEETEEINNVISDFEKLFL